MGCGVSKLEIEEARRGQGGEIMIVRRRSNQRAVADSTMLNKQLLEMSDNNKDSKIAASSIEEIKKKEEEEDDGDFNNREDEKDDDIPESSIIYPGSPSFRDYWILPPLSADDNSECSWSGPIYEVSPNKDQSDNNKKERKHEAKRGRSLGRRFRNVKNLLSHSTASGYPSQKPQVRSWD